MKEIFEAIDDAYFLLDKCITKLLKGRITKDEKLEQEAYCDMEYAVNGTMQNLSYLEGRLKGKTLSEWIKVEDRLPKEGQLCVIRGKSGWFEVVRFEIDKEGTPYWRNTETILFTIQSATHWLPIIEPKID